MDCWIINRHFVDSASFCWHSIFCWLDQRLNVYSRISTALNRWCKHHDGSARRCRCRCRQKPDAAQSAHTINRRSASGQRSKYVADRRSWYENRTSRFNKYYCNSKFSTLIITLSLTLTRTLTLSHVTTNPNPNPKQWAWPERAWPGGHVTALDQSNFRIQNRRFTLLTTNCGTTTRTRHPASCSVHDAENCAELMHSKLGLYFLLLHYFFGNQNINTLNYRFIIF